MIPLFLGLTAANLILLSLTFGLGLLATDPAGAVTRLHGVHLAMGVFAVLWATLTHLAVFTYFMATSKWLHAATDKMGAELDRFVAPALARKRAVLGMAMGAVVVTMLNAFAGAGADPTVNPWWPGEVHLMTAAATLAVNAVVAVAEFGQIRRQGRSIDDAVEVLSPA